MRDTRARSSIATSGLVLPKNWRDRTLPSLREELMVQLERAYLIETLRDCQGRIADAAARAGIHPRSLYNKMQQYGLRKEDYKRATDGPSRSGGRR